MNGVFNPPPPPPRPPEPKRTNGLAIASLCCAVGSVVVPVAWILGIIFGHIALRQIDRDPRQSGSGIAVAGLVIGYLILLFIISFGLLVAISNS
jgi:peptidyl-prolyl cis-trans isomerase B (cyclophilin B)